jgi:CheY-like chemotaxis protein
VVGQGSRFVISLPWQPNSTVQEARANLQPVAAIGPVQAAPLPSGQGTVLLAEDSYTNLLMVGDYLEGVGYQMVYAHTGQEALAKAEEYKPDIILMDIQMPEMDGLTAIRRLRAMPAFAATPIVALTALAMPGDRERCLEAGANEYVGKPIRLRQLAALIQELLNRI